MKLINRIILFFMFLSVFSLANINDNFFYDVYNQLLRKNIKNYKINYHGFRNIEFEKYIDTIELADLSGMSKDDKLAFWINAYNAFVIKNVLLNPDIESVAEIEGFFEKYKFKAAGKKLSLNQIKNDIIRSSFKEPLIHFGIFYAAKGSPPLNNIAYKGKDLTKQLEKNGKKYLQSPQGFKLDKKNKKIYLSKIFDWFKKDFGTNYSDIINFILPYLKKNDAEFIKKNRKNISINFLDFDWELNSE